MNGRVFVKRFVGVILILLALAMLGADAEVPTKAVAFLVFAVPGALLFRRTARDAEWKRKHDARELAGQIVVDSLAEGEREPREKKDHAKAVLAAGTALHVAAAPAMIVDKLRKMQK